MEDQVADDGVIGVVAIKGAQIGDVPGGGPAFRSAGFVRAGGHECVRPGAQGRNFDVGPAGRLGPQIKSVDCRAESRPGQTPRQLAGAGADFETAFAGM